MTNFLIDHILMQHGIDHYGFSDLGKPLSFEIYKQWIHDGYHANMNYLSEHLQIKENPQLLVKKATHAISFTAPYPNNTQNSLAIKHLKIAKYANGQDYHFWLKKRVEAICLDLNKLFPNNTFIGFTDSSPVLERDLAYRSGLGWFGKNSCIISRNRGSYFLIAEIYTNLAIDAGSITPSPDHCGTCDRCITACPTQAIMDNKTIDSNRCISYWTIEAKTSPPLDLAEKFDGNFFGCDICQDVCPWNSKVIKTNPTVEDLTHLTNELKWILTSSNKELERVFQGTPLLRSRGKGLKRNALIVIANKKIVALKEEVQKHTLNPELSELANWTLTSLAMQKSPN